MSKIKIFAIVMLIAMLAALPVGKALAVSSSETIGIGTIVNINFVTDGDGTSVLVDLLDSTNQAYAVKISLATAIAQGLVITNEDSKNTVAILKDVITEETTTGLVKSMVFDDDESPTMVLVTMNPEVSFDYTAAEAELYQFVTLDENSLMTAVELLVVPTEFLVIVPVLVTSIIVDFPELEESDVTVKFIIPGSEAEADVNISLEDAVSKGFVVANPEMLDTEIEFNEEDIVDTAAFGKAISKLGSFFAAANLVGIDFTSLQEYKDAGFGYGVITQALWMAANIGGDGVTFAMIMDAKDTGDFRLLSETATNWGQFRKEALTSGKQNLGQIMSGKAELETTSAEITTTETETTNTKTNNGNGNSNEKSNNGKANADSHGKSNKNKP